jgi:glycosyltransferase involved in cell wall biosynthesis
VKISFLVTKDLLQGGGGIETVTRELGRRLVTRGHCVVAYSTAGDGERPEEWEGIQIRWLPKARPYWTEKFFGSLYGAALARFHDPEPDIYHLHSVAAGATAWMLRHRSVPCLLQMHGVEWRRSRWGTAAKTTLRALENASFAGVAAVTAVSKEQCGFYREQFGKPVAFIPTGTDLKSYIPPAHLRAMGIEPGKYFFTAVRLVKEKGLHYAIPAVRKANGNWKLVIAGGDGGNQEYSQHLRELAEGCDNVLFLGHITEPLLGELYSNAGAYLQASEIEGMSVSVLDAMSYGRCCIVSDIPENLDAVGEAGISFHNADIDDLVQKLRWAEQSSVPVAEIGARARSYVIERFSWDMVTKNMEALYRKTIDRVRKQREQENAPFGSTERVIHGPVAQITGISAADQHGIQFERR